MELVKDSTHTNDDEGRSESEDRTLGTRPPQAPPFEGGETPLLTHDQQREYLDMLLRGASPPAAMREMEIRPAMLRRTLDESDAFRQAQADVAEQLNQNVATAVYHAAMKGNVTAQALWLKNRPPPDWCDVDANVSHSSSLSSRNDFDALTDQELIDLARAAGLAIPDELAAIAE